MTVRIRHCRSAESAHACLQPELQLSARSARLPRDSPAMCTAQLGTTMRVFQAGPSTAQLAFALAMIVTMGVHPATGDAHRNASLAPWEKVLADAPWAPRDSAGFYVGANGAPPAFVC